LLLKIDFDASDRTFRSQVQNEILDDVAKKQDLQSPDSINIELLEEIAATFNGLIYTANGPKGSQGKNDYPLALKEKLY